jgi:Microtubule binding
MVGKLIEKVAALERTLLDAEKVRRKLHNDLVEIRGNIRVFCRIRPCDRPPVAEATAADAMRLMVDAKPNDFYFDRCGPVAAHFIALLCRPCASILSLLFRAPNHVLHGGHHTQVATRLQSAWACASCREL